MTKQIGLRQCPECDGFGFANYTDEVLDPWEENRLIECITCAGSGIWIPFDHDGLWAGEVGIINGFIEFRARKLRLLHAMPVIDGHPLMLLDMRMKDYPWRIYYGRVTYEDWVRGY